VPLVQRVPVEPVGFDITWVISGLLFIPYLVWGVHLLRVQMSENREVPPHIAAFTLIAVAVFFFFQYFLMSMWMGPTPLKLVVSLIALFVSGAALYGHLIIGLLSSGLVDMMMPSDDRRDEVPSYGPAEALELNGDFEGAVREYRVVAQMFPKDATAVLRIGDNLLKLGRAEEAVPYLEDGMGLLSAPDRALSVAYRLTDIYLRTLERPEEARRVLREYLEMFPESERADSVRNRLDKIAGQGISA
jgi:tetratricopeptide (TPR) repeat protein